MSFSPFSPGGLVPLKHSDAGTRRQDKLPQPVGLARWWTEESAGRLQRRIPMAMGALAQDGGVAIHNLTTEIPDQEWLPLAKEFFLS